MVSRFEEIRQRTSCGIRDGHRARSVVGLRTRPCTRDDSVCEDAAPHLPVNAGVRDQGSGVRRRGAFTPRKTLNCENVVRVQADIWGPDVWLEGTVFGIGSFGAENAGLKAGDFEANVYVYADIFLKNRRFSGVFWAKMGDFRAVLERVCAGPTLDLYS